ncbi:MAG: response regulator transcription factor [Thermoanaerobacteraceae bacterium]|nr:response regulator transcription factor [Thermoanaerobacteraceae bacterium]
MSTRIILADDHKIVRDGLAALLAKVPGLEVVAEAADGRTAVRLAREMLPDVVIMDISMPDLNGIEATRQIVAEVSGVKVIALSMHSGRRLVMEVFKAGASGYLFKDCAFEELASAIRSVVAGDTYLSPKIAGVMVKELATQSLTDTPVAFSVLTAREREVLQLLAEGKTTKKIASLLHLSTKTVETHRQQIMNKLNVQSVADLVKYAIREGLTSL